MIYGDHILGLFNDLIVSGGGDSSTRAMMTVTVKCESDDAYELLTREDVERLRELCDEALS